MNTPLLAVGLLPLVCSVILGVSIASGMLNASTQDVLCRMESARRDAIERIDAGEPVQINLKAGEGCNMTARPLSAPAE